MINDSLTAYKIWAPENSIWTVWAKPVLFANTAASACTLNMPAVNWLSSELVQSDTMIIIDLPGKDGVEEGLALAKVGYRPVPLYNGVNGPNPDIMMVDVREIVAALFQGADMLFTINERIQKNALPVFLLDSNRLKEKTKTQGKYDNRWCIFPQDMPSAAFLTNQGIKKIIVRSKTIQDDLSQILSRYMQQGIKIYLCDYSNEIKEAKISKPSMFKNLFYRFSVISGLTRNPTGGFGGDIPIRNTYSSGGVYYHRMG